MTKKTTRHALISLIAIASLAACGGGGGGAPAPGPVAAIPAPVPPAPVPAQVASIVTSVAKSTYAAGSEEESAFDLLNRERSHCGFGLLAQDTKLDQSAGSHAKFTVENGVFTYGHTEAPGLPFFTGVTETDRAKAAGYTGSVSAVLATGFNKIGNIRAATEVRGLLAAPYHLIGMMDAYADVGVGYATKAAPANTFDPTNWHHESVATNITLGARAGVNGLDPALVYTYPCAGSTGVAHALPNEIPSPIPLNLTQNHLLYGTPIAIMVRTGKKLKVTGVTLAPAAGGAPVAMTVIDQVNDPQKGALYIAPASVTYALSMSPLLPLTAYTSTATGTSDGVAFTKTFTFTTGN